MMLLAGITALQLLQLVSAKTVTYDWDVGWVRAAPDGYERPVIGVNGAWPCPAIHATKGDKVVINLTNNLGNQTTGLHWHGLSQVNTNPMDGAVMTNQCPLPPGSSMTYKFTVDEGGSYWWHSHDTGQYPDGLRAPLIVDDPDDPYAGLYDKEYTLLLSDWYHEQAVTLVQNQLLTPNNTKFAPPLPDSLVVNDGQGATYAVEAGKTYRFRLIAVSALTAFMVTFKDHPMTVIMTDATYVKNTTVDMLRVDSAQRYDVLVSIGKNQKSNSPFLVAMDANRDYSNPDLPAPQWKHNQTGYLVVDAKGSTNATEVVNKFDPADESRFPALKYTPLGIADKVYKFDFNFCFDANGIPRACLNDTNGENGPYIDPKVPSLYSAVTTGEANENSTVYGDVHPMIANHGDIIDIVLNNQDEAVHPFHLHGHQFEVLYRAPTGAGNWPGTDAASSLYSTKPPVRDTYTIRGNSYAVIRFKADNPGVFLYHCHIEWHVAMGLVATVIEAPEKLRNYTIPQDHIDACKAGNTLYEGNAGGSDTDFYDTSNYNTINAYPFEGALYYPSTTLSSAATAAPVTKTATVAQYQTPV